MTDWLDPALRTPLLRQLDAPGLAREDGWSPGGMEPLPAAQVARIAIRAQAIGGDRAHPRPRRPRARLSARPRSSRCSRRAGADFAAVCRAADELRAARVGDTVTYVVNRNINYTNICTYGCKFCAFSKGRHSLGQRDKPYDLEPRRDRAAHARGLGSAAPPRCACRAASGPATPATPISSSSQAVKSAAPDMHVHAFSPLEIWHGADTLGLPLRDYLARLKDAGLASLPGTAAEILDDEVRAVLCPDKINTAAVAAR